MNRLIILLLIAFACGADFDSYFTDRTLRLDYFHSGNATEERISFDQVRQEGTWPGSRRILLDDSDLGKYYFEVIDLTSVTVIYSRGFCSIYGEYETTGEALAGNWGTFHESLRFPEPRDEFIVRLYKRQDNGKFREIWARRIDPQSYQINRAPVLSTGKVWNIISTGGTADKVDILVMGDGYTKRETVKFKFDAKRLVDALFATEPFKSRRSDFNVRGLNISSPEKGISNPRGRAWKNSALDLRYNTFDSDRYVLAYENKLIREISAQAPYDALVILVNSDKYGGGGIFNLYATVAVDTDPAAYIMIHEFGHSFGGLGDEYYTTDVAYEEFIPAGVEPWDPNVTALLEPGTVKWGALVAPGTPLPTPWNQSGYDSARSSYQAARERLVISGSTSADSMNSLFAAVRAATEPVLKANQYWGRVGAFEGAGYQEKGLYRPEIDCIMFSRNPDYFCRVCRAAIERMIDLHTK
ncbi:MAG: M64 family metallopeptidase [Candidatus Neomarinimicrobiota bacterium]